VKPLFQIDVLAVWPIARSFPESESISSISCSKADVDNMAEASACRGITLPPPVQRAISLLLPTEEAKNGVPAAHASKSTNGEYSTCDARMKRFADF